VRTFTLEEAEALIPRLERVFEACAEIRARAEERAGRLRALEARRDPDPAQLALERGQLEFLAASLDDALREVTRMGALLKGLAPALVDFPAVIEGRAALLCWRMGERRIAHWHGLEEGFAGRRPLPRALLH
jgi:hypothetical protein